MTHSKHCHFGKSFFILLLALIMLSGAGFAEPPGGCQVHFLDVGQADSILIQAGQAAMLIDAGNNADADRIVRYIHAQRIGKLDYIIGTHPHEDHIGGLDQVVRSYEVGKVILPNVPHTTKTFEDLLLAVADRGLKITSPIVNSGYPLGKGYFTILAPQRHTYGNLNDYSIVIRFVYGKTVFLFPGDAAEVSEADMVSKKLNLKADVLKVGHHGSRSSTTKAFLAAVKPAYAVISVGTDNDYGHPAPETLSRLKNEGVTVYRTDLCGTIIATSNGDTVTLQTEKTPAGPEIVNAPNETPRAGQYIGNVKSKKFHKPTCRNLPEPENRHYFSSRNDAITAGYTPCGGCKP